MCGIAGVFQNMAVAPDRERLEAMGRSMRYRGADDAGLFVGTDLSSRTYAHCALPDSERFKREAIR